jgi:quercetin dioxygenase-like cupin family protein
MHFGITSFGINAYTTPKAGQDLVGEHNEADTRHEELFLVTRGHATFRVEGEDVDAPAGTLVHVPDPEAMRSARAEEDNTTVVCIGGAPGQAFEVSEWEQKYDRAAAS